MNSDKAELLNIVVGAGPVGNAVARLLASRGEPLLMVSRSGGSTAPWQHAAADVRDVAQMSRLLGMHTRLFLCAAPPYAQWRTDFAPLIDGIAGAAKGRAVDIVYADNMYCYGPVEGSIDETTPPRPNTVKGRIRLAAAQQLAQLHGQGEVRVAIARAADFFGPGVSRSALGSRVFSAIREGQPAYVLGDPSQLHTYTYVPDFAEALLKLSREPSAYGDVWHVPNAPTVTTSAILAQIATHYRQKLKVRAAGPLMARLLSLFDAQIREASEMLYLFLQPFVVDHGKYARMFGDTATPLAAALAQTADAVALAPQTT